MSTPAFQRLIVVTRRNEPLTRGDVVPCWESRALPDPGSTPVFTVITRSVKSMS